MVVPDADAAVTAGRLLEDLPALWEKADMAERRRILTTMLDAVYVDTVEERRIVAIRPRAAFRPLLEKAGLPAEHSVDQNDPATWAERAELYAQAFASKTQAEWSGIFSGTDACVAPVLSMDDAVNHPHMAARQTLVEVDGVLQAAPAPRFSRSKPTGINTPKAMGGDTAAIRRALHEAPKSE